MRNLTLALALALPAALAVATPAHAGPFDPLPAVDLCYTKQTPPIVSMPDGTIVAGAAKIDDDLLNGQGSPGWGGVASDPHHKVATWCVQEVTTKIDGKDTLLVGSGFVAIRWSEDSADMNGPDIMDGSSFAALWAVPVADKDATAAAKAGTLKAPPPLPEGKDDAPDATAVILKASSTKKLLALSGKDVLVIGSAPYQHSTNDYSARQMLGGWNLDLSVDPKVISGKNDKTHQAWVLANVTATPHKKNGPAITYRVLYGLYQVKKKWRLGLVHFALVQ